MNLRSCFLGLSLAFIAHASPAADPFVLTGPMMTPAPAATLGSHCVDADFEKYFNFHWATVLAELQAHTTSDFYVNLDTERTKNLAARTDAFLSAATVCHELGLFENILDLYAQAFGDLREHHYVYATGLPHSFFEDYARRRLDQPARMWVNSVVDHVIDRRTGLRSHRWFPLPVEHQLGSAKLVHALARSIAFIGQLPDWKRTERMERFAAAYWKVVAEDHLARWVFRGPGEFQPIDGKNCKVVLERYNLDDHFQRLLDREFGDPGRAEPLSYCNALSDRDLIMVNAVVEALAANAADPHLAPLAPETRNHFERVLATFAFLFEDRITITELDSRSGYSVKGMLPDQGFMDDHRDYCFSQDERADLPVPTEDPCISEDIGWDFNHSKTLLTLLRALRDHGGSVPLPPSSGKFPAEMYLELLANQVVYGVFNGDWSRPLFRTYMDGSNGWYRVKKPKTGYVLLGFCPSCRSDAYYNGGWAALEDYNTELINLNSVLAGMLRVAYTDDRTRVDPAAFSETRTWMREYYGVRVGIRSSSAERGPKPQGIGNVPPLDRSAGKFLKPGHLRTVLAAIARFAF